MSWQQTEFMTKQSSTTLNYNHIDSVHKPVEIYLFLDPFSEKCWSLHYYLKKLTLEYGRFFNVRVIISSRLSLVKKKPKEKTSDMCCPINTALAIKASELQGKRAGKIFLRKLQEKFFIEKMDISQLDILFECAMEAALDMREFERDIVSSTAQKAYQCDMRLTNEMDVDTLPTMVFFNQTVEEHGIKISGLHPYEIYEMVLSEILQYQPIPSIKPPLEDLVKRSSIITTEEIAIIYDWSEAKALREIKKLQLRQLVEMIVKEHQTFWKPI